jgi:hypothetical protein
MAPGVIKAIPGKIDFFLQMIFMAEQGRDADAGFFMESIEGMAPGQKGQIDSAAVGVVADGAFHSKLRFSVKKRAAGSKKIKSNRRAGRAAGAAGTGRPGFSLVSVLLIPKMRGT